MRVLPHGSFNLQGMHPGSLLTSSSSNAFYDKTIAFSLTVIEKVPCSIKIKHTLYFNVPYIQTENSVNYSCCL